MVYTSRYPRLYHKSIHQCSRVYESTVGQCGVYPSSNTVLVYHDQHCLQLILIMMLLSASTAVVLWRSMVGIVVTSTVIDSMLMGPSGYTPWSLITILVGMPSVISYSILCMYQPWLCYYVPWYVHSDQHCLQLILIMMLLTGTMSSHHRSTSSTHRHHHTRHQGTCWVSTCCRRHHV